MALLGKVSDQSILPRARLSARQRTRSKTGSAALKAVCGMLLMIGIVVLGAIFLIGAGMTVYYKQKIGLVANWAAQRAASICSWCSSVDNRLKDNDAALSQETEEVVNAALSKMGLPKASGVQAHLEGEYVTVSITVSGLPLLGSGIIAPAAITLADRAAAVLNNDKPPMLVLISTINKQQIGKCDDRVTALVPAYGRYDGSLIPKYFSGKSKEAELIRQLDNMGSPWRASK